MERFKDKINGKWISLYQELSEAFIEKFKDDIDWQSINYYQDISLKFREKYDLYNLEDRCDLEADYFYTLDYYDEPINLTFLEKHKIIRSIYGQYHYTEDEVNQIKEKEVKT
jgi:hypothetical protein